MEDKHEDLKKKLKEHYDELIERMIGKQRGADEISLEEIEEAALEIGRAVQSAVTREMVEQSEAQERGKRPRCPTCGVKMRDKGYREKDLVTRSGEVRVKRKYWYCEECESGIFPPGSALEAG